MKIYFHFSQSTFVNSYLIGNEKTKEAIIIDPVKVTYKMVEQIERNEFNLKAILITHNHEKSHENGVKTVLKMYPAVVYAEDTAIDGIKTVSLKGDGCITEAGFTIRHFSIQGHAIIYKIENVIFSGTALSAGMLQKTPVFFALKHLKFSLENKIMIHSDDTVIMPAFGPPTSIGAEKKTNIFFADDCKKKKGAVL